MLQARSGCSLTELRQLRPFQHADDRLLQALANQVTPQWAPRGTRMIALGSDDEATYFLLEGTVRLVAGDSSEATLSADDPVARRPLSHLRPRRHDVICDTTVRYLRIDNRLLAGLAASFAEPLDRVTVADEAPPPPSVAALESEFADEIQAALEKDLLTLPSLPDIAVRVGRAVLDEKSNSRRVAAVVQTDPVITAKLVRAANSAFFPTPAGATWGQVRLRLVDGHTVSVTVGATHGVFTYAQLGMANRKSGNPTVQWELLRLFAQGDGVLTWRSAGAERRNQKRRELLARCLARFFRIGGDPFQAHGNGWRARFQVGGPE